MSDRRKHASVEEYLADLSVEQREAVDQLRSTIRAALPDEATEVISYQILGYRVGKGRPVVWLAAFADHYSLYPYTETMRERLGAALDPHLSGKGTIRLDADKPLPLELVRRIVEVRLAEHESAATAR